MRDKMKVGKARWGVGLREVMYESILLKIMRSFNGKEGGAKKKGRSLDGNVGCLYTYTHIGTLIAASSILHMRS